MKRCFLIVGAESSGNRLLGKLLVNAGCFGDDRMDGPFSQRLPCDEALAVVIRSYPHGDEWPDIVAIYTELRAKGYQVMVLVAIRDWHCTLQSQIHSQHHPKELALANIRRAYGEIFTGLATINCWHTVISYEALVSTPQAQTVLLHRLGLEGEPIETYNGNDKHYGRIV